MFQRIIDEMKNRAGSAVRLSCLATAAALALAVAVSFLCAAGFVAVQQRYGSIEACLAGAALFFVFGLIAFASYLAARRRARILAAAAARSAAHSALLADPKLVAVGIQVIRAIGIKRLIPLVAIGGVALGLFAANRRDVVDQTTPAE